MRRFLQKQTTSEAILQRTTIINGAMFSSIILLLMLLATPSFATCYNVNDGGTIGYHKSICSGENVTISNVTLPSGGSGSLEYAWLFNTSGPSFSGSYTVHNSSNSYSLTYVTQTVWVSRCARRAGCSSWDFGESNWVKITVNNAEFEHVNGVNESACNANNGKIITDPYINKGTALPYYVQYKFNGTTTTAGPFNSNGDHAITGLAPGVYSNITMIDANGCEDIYGSNITIQEYTNGCNTDCSQFSFQSTQKHDPVCGVSNGTIKVKVNNPNNYCLVYRLYNYTTNSWHTDYQTSRLFKNLPQGQYRVKMYKNNSCDINNLDLTCYTPSEYLTLGCENLCSSHLTINNNGSCATRIYWWVNTGDQFVKTLQPGESWTTTTYDTYMWRAINDNPNWSNLLYDEHYTTSGCSNATWNLTPDYCAPSCTGTINSIVLTNDNNESITLQDGGTYKLCDLPVDNYLEALVNGNHESFKFTVDGDHRTENAVPYNYPAVSNGQTWNPGVGTHTIIGKLYSENNASGNLCDEIEIEITITECNGTIGNFVFNDVNGNGIQEANEFGIPGVTVMLLDANGNMVDQTDTDADGKYTFNNVVPDDYKVKFPATGSAANLTYILTQPNQGNDEDLDSDPIVSQNPAEAITEVFTVNEGDEITNIDAGYYITSKITGITWDDKNGNGLQDLNEPGLDGIVVMLLEDNGDMIEQATTSGNGVYTFDNLAPGDYKVKFPEDANLSNTNYTLTQPNEGNNDNLDSDAVPMNDGSGNSMTQIVSVANGATIDNLDAGYIPLAKIGNFVFDDANGNGIQDNGETGIQGVTVTIQYAGGFFLDNTTTDEFGFYSFDDLLPGDYEIRVSSELVLGGTSYTLTLDNQGTSDDLDSDPIRLIGDSGNAETDVINVQYGQNIDNIDIGYIKVTAIGDMVFDDANANGIQDNGEGGLKGVTVFLLDGDGNILDDTTTDEFGKYTFDNLTAGDYKVQVINDVVVDGINYTLTNPNEGTSDDLDSDGERNNLTPGEAMSAVISIQEGDVIDNLDFGYIKSARIGDMTFKDNNEDGIMNSGDEVFRGVTVELSGTDIFGNNVTKTTTTNSLGKYDFDFLTPGTYVLTFTSPTSTFVPTTQDAMGNSSDDNDSDINSTGRTESITLSIGEYNETIDAGFKFDSSLPVALTSFEARLINNNQVILKWATASEENNRHFIVERSVDGVDFEPIGVVAGNGTTNTINHYQLEDMDPFFGNNYYRLKQVDFNGEYEYSNVEIVLISGHDLPDVFVYPNPVVRTTTLRVVTPFEQDATIEIVDQTGKITQTLTILQGANSKQMDLSENAPGLYFAYINYNGHRTLVYTIVKVEE